MPITLDSSKVEIPAASASVAKVCRRQRGSVFKTKNGYGIRWIEDGKRPQRNGFKTKTEARRWFANNVASRLGTGAPLSDITFDTFCDLFLDRHGATVAASTKRTLEERLASSRERFGDWTLRELEGASDDLAAWRASLSETSRYRLMSAFRQALGTAVRWRYIARNPAAAERNPQPRSEELRPFEPEQIDAIATELGSSFGPLVIVAAGFAADRRGPRSVRHRPHRSAGTGPGRVRVSARRSPELAGMPLPVGRFLYTREDYELETGSSPASTWSTSAARTVSSIDASFTKPAGKRSSCASERASRSTREVASGERALCSQRRRISAARGSETVRSRKPRSISASEGLALTARCAGRTGSTGGRRVGV